MLRSLEDAILGLLIVATTLVVLLEVLFRYVLDQPLSWSSGVATDLLAWTAFLGLAVAFRDDAHVALELVSRHVPASTQKLLRGVRLASSVAFLVALTAGGAGLIITALPEHSPEGIPLWLIYASLPVGGALGLGHTVRHLWVLLRGHDGGG